MSPTTFTRGRVGSPNDAIAQVRDAGSLEHADEFETVARAIAERAILRPLIRSRAPVLGSGERRGQLDIKHGGMIPIVDLARWAGMTAGGASASTQERLRAALTPWSRR